MRVIDCDAHVEECVETWQYLDPEFYLLRPIPVTFPEDTCFGWHNAAWVIDYKLRFFAANPTTMKRAGEKDVSIPVQEMRDVKTRLRHMDELGIDTQVVFPSIWLGCLAENVELEAALARSYNQFMATQCAQSGGRICYVAIVPWRRPNMAVTEIRRVKTLGCAAGIYARGIEWDRPLTHSDHWPIYEEAANQDLPVTVHVGNGSSPMIREMFQGVPRPTYEDGKPHVHPLGKGIVSGPYVLYAFQQILGSKLLEDFPKLRVAFLEAGSEWTVQLIKGLRGQNGAKIDQWLAERVFVSCAMDDDLPYIIGKNGDDFLVTATDFPHGDAFRQDQLANGLKARGDLSDRTMEKILSANPQRLFHF
ncbi:MAG: amidohydrolase family protein [Candidatus Binatia bacterium]